MTEYIGDYESNFSTDIASLVWLELQAAENPEMKRSRMIRTLERHAEALENGRPELEDEE